MDIIGGIGAATEGLKLINELRKIDKELDKADLKLRLVDLADKLMDAKQALLDAQENQHSLQREIAALEAKLRQTARMRDERGLLYEVDDHGARIGEPYCNQCYVKEDKLYRMLSTERASGSGYVCSNCKTLIITQKKPPLRPQEPRGKPWFDR
ncbi:hypothetical protein [Albidovulum sp.]|jgi:hypothetical protein|uniref:hypothetical protein n=1 Tax=Albidovulum sp. TaxID=1872424 RepID=UPI003045B7EE